MSLKYLGSLRTEITHLQSASNIITDAPVDNNGKGESFSPTDLVCSALASCMTTLMGIYANKHHFSLNHLEADITKVMAANPRKIKEVIIQFTSNDLSVGSTHLEGLKNAALSCPVALNLSADIKQTIHLNF